MSSIIHMDECVRSRFGEGLVCLLCCSEMHVKRKEMRRTYDGKVHCRPHLGRVKQFPDIPDHGNRV